MRIKLDYILTPYDVFCALSPSGCSSLSQGHIECISTDSREVEKGDLFFALPGESFNGEDFVSSAKSKGAYTVSSRYRDADFFVPDTLSALSALSSFYKRKLSIRKTVAITGSVGKTTTKELTLNLLLESFKTHGTYKNHNNQIGVPITLLSAKRDTEILVIEAGMNHMGEIEKISRCIEPDISVITKIGTAHIGNLGSIEKIVEAKSEILLGMKNPYVLIPYEDKFLKRFDFTKTVSTLNENADFYLSISKSDESGTEFDFKSHFNTVRSAKIKTRLSHIPECLAFALAVSSSIGMSDEQMASAINKLPMEDDKKIYSIGKLTIIDDTYNSSLESVKMSFKTLSLSYSEKNSAVLGDVLELGEKTMSIHYEIGCIAAGAKLSKLYLFGKNAKFIKKGALDNGMKEDAIFLNEDIDAPGITAEQILSNSSDETILFKASRKVRLERVIEIIKAR